MNEHRTTKSWVKQSELFSRLKPLKKKRYNLRCFKRIIIRSWAQEKRSSDFTRGERYGVGLFLSKRVIDDHGGSITLDPLYKKGAGFIIKFPIKKPVP